MIQINKNVGETPLELLERLRRERPELAQETLSYAGRLDPMAEGVMLVLVGEEENKKENREKFLGKDKEYVATFLVGAKTDTGDCLGLITSDIDGVHNTDSASEVTESKIKNQVEELKSINTQTYPWFSGKTVDGTKLFDHFKSGNTDIERPEQNIQIKEVEMRDFWPQKTEDVKNYIFDSVAKVHGDFRQEEIVASWRKFFAEYKNEKIPTFEIRIVVSSGTFIRALTENFDFPTTLLKLKRIGIKYNEL